MLCAADRAHAWLHCASRALCLHCLIRQWRAPPSSSRRGWQQLWQRDGPRDDRARGLGQQRAAARAAVIPAQQRLCRCSPSERAAGAAVPECKLHLDSPTAIVRPWLCSCWKAQVCCRARQQAAHESASCRRSGTAASASRSARCKEPAGEASLCATSVTPRACMMLYMTADKLPISMSKLAHPAACTTCRWVYSRGRTQHATVELPGAALHPVGSENAQLHEPPAAARDAACAFAALSCTALRYKSNGQQQVALNGREWTADMELLPCAWVSCLAPGHT